MKDCPFTVLTLSAIFVIIIFVEIVKHVRAVFDPANKEIHQKILDESVNNNRSECVESYEDYILKQCTTIGARSIFIAGLGQQALMRFMPSPLIFLETDHSANFFLVTASFATASGMISTFINVTILVFLPDMPLSKQRLFAILIKPISQLSFFLYGCSFFCIAFVLVFVGEGTGYAQSLVTRHQDMASIATSIGLIFFLYTMHGAVYIRNTRVCIAREWSLAQSSSSKLGQQKQQGFEDETATRSEDVITYLCRCSCLFSQSHRTDYGTVQEEFSAYMHRINTAGSMSTFASGYLFYNVITMETDVLRVQTGETD